MSVGWVLGRRREVFASTLQKARGQRGVALMGICNVTPDSFSDGGLHFSFDRARARVDELLAQGADVIDIGGESTRPGAPPVPADEQIARVLDVVRFAVGRGACVSVDTTDPTVAAACLDAGACVVNDISCLRDPKLAEVAAKADAVLVLMHARGTQAEMKGFSQYPDDAYGDVVADVLAEWEEAAARATAHGLPRSALVMDPGFGFAKNARHSLELLRRLGEITTSLDVPVLVGASRKSFLRLADDKAAPSDRLGASVAAALYAAEQGAALLRVHDVAATRQALDLFRVLARDPFRVGTHDRHRVPTQVPPSGERSVARPPSAGQVG